MTIRTIFKNFLNSSVTGKLFNQSKEIYKHERGQSGRVKSLCSAAKYSYKELGTIDSIFAGMGAIAGTVLLPVPGGGLIAAEGMLQMSKYGGKCAKIVEKNISRIF